MTRARWKLKQDRSPQRTKIVTVRSPRSRAPLPGETASPTDHWIRPGNGADRTQRSPRRTRATAEHGIALFVPSGDRAPWCRTPVAHADRKRDVRDLREVAVRGSFRSVRVAEGDARMIKRRYGVATASARGPAFKEDPLAVDMDPHHHQSSCVDDGLTYSQCGASDRKQNGVAQADSSPAATDQKDRAAT